MRGDARLEDVIPVADYFGFEDLQEVLKKQVKKVRDPLSNVRIVCIFISSGGGMCGKTCPCRRGKCR